MRVKCFMSAPPLRMLAHKNTCVKNLSVKGGANVKQACAISTSLGTKRAVLQSIRMIILMDNDAGPCCSQGLCTGYNTLRVSSMLTSEAQDRYLEHSSKWALAQRRAGRWP